MTLSIMSFLISCTENDRTSIAPSNADPYKEVLLEMGFQEEYIEIVSGGYLVEGDLLYTREVLEPFLQNDETADKHRSICPSGSGFPLNIDNVSNVEFFLDHNTLPTFWIIQLKAAIDEYNALEGTAISMRWRKIMPGTTYDGPNQCLVRAEYNYSTSANAWVQPRPCLSGEIGWELVINLATNSGSPEQRKQISMHEMAHVIGFHHTNTSQGTYISGTCVDDPLSIVHTDGWGSPPVFTTCDVEAFQLAYPD
ncbi:MAG: hypothetical protein KC587_14920 [Nitrospira sp.]|nr:hypothetical protein [Nitrospira sp.]